MKKTLVILTLLLIAFTAIAFKQELLLASHPSGGGGGVIGFRSEAGVVGATDGNATLAMTLTTNISVGDTLAIQAHTSVDCGNITFSDSQGNAYSYAVTNNQGSDGVFIIGYTKATHALTTSDTVTMTVSSPAFCNRWLEGIQLTNSTALDIIAANNSFGTTITCSASTSTHTVIIGLLDQGTATYTPGNFAVLRTIDFSHKFGIMVQDSPTPGSQDMAGSLDSGATWKACWAAFK